MRQQIPQAQLQIQRIDRIRRGLAQATVHEQGPPVRRHFGLAQLDQALTAGARLDDTEIRHRLFPVQQVRQIVVVQGQTLPDPKVPAYRVIQAACNSELG